MTPKQKATELIEMFADENSRANDGNLWDANGEQCALICINQMIKYTSVKDEKQPFVILRDAFLLDVRDEINKQIRLNE